MELGRATAALANREVSVAEARWLAGEDVDLRWDADPGDFVPAPAWDAPEAEAECEVEGLVAKLVTSAVTSTAQGEPELSVVRLSDLSGEIDEALETYVKIVKAAGLFEPATPDCEVREWAATQQQRGWLVLALCTVGEPVELVGCVTVSAASTDRVAVCDLALAAARRGNGYGTSLMLSMQRAAASCGQGLQLKAARGRLLWYCKVLGFEFCEAEDARVHALLAPPAVTAHGRPLMPLHLRLPLELKLLAGVQKLKSFNRGDEWIDAALDELNTYVDTFNSAAAADLTPVISGPVRLHWSSLLHAMLRDALRSLPPLSVLQGCQNTCAAALRDIDIQKRTEQQRVRRLEREKTEQEEEETRRTAAAAARDEAAAAAEAQAGQTAAAALVEEAATRRRTKLQADARQQLGIPAEGDGGGTSLTMSDLVSAYSRQVESVRGENNEQAVKARMGTAVEVLVSADPTLRATAADNDADADMGTDLVAAAKAANESAAKAQALSEAEMRAVVQFTPSGGPLAQLANFEAETLHSNLQEALSRITDAHDRAVRAARDAEVALGDLGGRIVTLGDSGVRGPLAVPSQLLQRQRAAKFEADAAKTAVSVIARHRSSVQGSLTQLRDRLDGPTAEEVKRIVCALVEHFHDAQPTLEGVLPHVSDSELRQVACKDDVRRAVNCWRGRSVVGVASAPLTPIQQLWQLHPAWSHETSIDDGADRAAAMFAADHAAAVFHAGAVPAENSRSSKARPTDGKLKEVALTRAREMGAAFWDHLPPDAAVVCLHEAFVKAYFTGVDFGTSPSIDDALDHLIHDPCYGRRKPAPCGLCKRVKVFGSRLQEVAEAGADAVRSSESRFFKWSFFKLEASHPELLFSTKHGVTALEAGAASCATSRHTLLKRKRVEQCLAPRPSCCDVLSKIRDLRLKGIEQCNTCGLHLPDETQPGYAEAIDRLQKQAKGL